MNNARAPAITVSYTQSATKRAVAFYENERLSKATDMIVYQQRHSTKYTLKYPTQKKNEKTKKKIKRRNCGK